MSSYIDSNLMPNEKVIFRTRPHWVIFSSAIATAVVVLFALIAGPFTSIGQWEILGRRVFVWAVMLGTVGTIFVGFVAYIDYISSEFGITNKRVLIKLGFISRRSLEVLLPKIESIAVIQSIPGRVLKYGSIIISGTGGSKDTFRNIPKPLEFRKLIQEQVDMYEEDHR